MPDSTASLIQTATGNPPVNNSADLVSAYKIPFLHNSPSNKPVLPFEMAIFNQSTRGTFSK
jgi:hypothetical protein